MPYYSILLVGGNVADLNELKQMFPDYRDPDYTNSNVILVQRSYDVVTLRRHVSGLVRSGVTIECKPISRKIFDWKKYQ